MELANVMVALGGDTGNTVPKSNVTPAEVAVLIAIHGEDAVFDIRILKEKTDVKPRDMVARLREMYPAKDEDGNPIIDQVYPGRTPLVHKSFEDLDLPEEHYVATDRAAPKAKTQRKSGSRVKPPADASTTKANGGNNSVLD